MVGWLPSHSSGERAIQKNSPWEIPKSCLFFYKRLQIFLKECLQCGSSRILVCTFHTYGDSLALLSR